VELALFGPDFGNVDVEVANGVAPERPFWLIALDLREAADAVPLQAAMQR
jgi:hypothetical protein